jgi:hypothetical protein
MGLIYVIATVGLTAILMLQAIGSYNNVAAQTYFSQDVRINIDKGQSALGNYGVVLSDKTTSDKKINYYTDRPSSPQIIYVPGSILAFDGDTLVACAMIMDTRAIACDTQYANRYSSPLQFYIKMDEASPVR